METSNCSNIAVLTLQAVCRMQTAISELLSLPAAHSSRGQGHAGESRQGGGHRWVEVQSRRRKRKEQKAENRPQAFPPPQLETVKEFQAIQSCGPLQVLRDEEGCSLHHHGMGLTLYSYR